MRVRPFQKMDMAKVVLLYRTCYAEKPWFEYFDPKDVEEEFLEILSWPDAIFLVCEDKGRILGAAIGFSIAHKPDVKALISQSAINGFYFSDLFVDSSKRNHGIGKRLVKARFDLAKRRGFEFGIVRTSVAQPIIQHLYVDQLGYRIVARQETMSTKVINGVTQEAPDTRVIMMGNFFPPITNCEH